MCNSQESVLKTYMETTKVTVGEGNYAAAPIMVNEYDT
jgi:hypothetical protein